MQLPLYGDMNFRSKTMSEDCLYLNIWKPEVAQALPVLVYFYGGGFQAGDGSEPRYDGESMARNGIITVTVNYRLGIFGFFSHPELTKEDPHSAGNQGLMDQSAALKWVYENIAAFGGDPNRITIAGESAGSMSVSAQLASPLSIPYINGAIGESGSLMGKIFGRSLTISLKEGEEKGKKFGLNHNAKHLKDLRALPAAQLMEWANAEHPVSFAIDGHFLPDEPEKIYEKGLQAKVPLLVGWNSEEMTPKAITQKELNEASLKEASEQFYPKHGAEIAEAYLQSCHGDAVEAITDLSGDLFLGYPTWIWSHLHAQTSNQPVYRYYYARPRPGMRPEFGNAQAGLAGGIIEGKEGEEAPAAPPATGAVHSAEIEYCMGNLRSNRVFDWTEEDYRVSEIMQTQFVNFIRTSSPNGPSVPQWNPQQEGQTMHINVQTGAKVETREARYALLKSLLNP
jgi:para-nitrobenzyl esterase